MAPRYGVLGGTALRDVGEHEVRVETPWGPADVGFAREGDREVVFLERHATPEGRVPAHRVPHRRNGAAFARAGVEDVVGVHAAGGLDPDLEPGALLAPSGLVDATGAPPTVHDGGVVHVGMDPPFCPRVREALLAAPEVGGAGAYVQTWGPRLETPEEVDLLARAGDLVGMTAAGEAAVARELGLCYASLSLVVNPAPGLGGPVTAEDVASRAREAAPRLRAAVDAALAGIPEDDCRCGEAPAEGRLG